MADETDTPADDTGTDDTGAPVQRRRAARKSTSQTDAAKPSATKHASRPASTPANMSAANGASTTDPMRAPDPDPQTRTVRARDTLGKAANGTGGKRGLIVGGLAAAGVAAVALLSLRGSTPRKAVPANDPGSKAHQPDGTDSSGQMEAMIADESMVPESTPNA
ncbi:hypothetical protein [uncultured Sphingomonas sp.]|uniref:hypothetical protein n=1 Tax=uncultured Sphingomonas sp. TaxID=158754 RepID=UPI0035CC6AF7